MLFDDFLTNYALWLWVPHRASLVRDDGGGFRIRVQTATALASCSSLRAQRSNPWHVRNEGGLLRCARNDGFGDGWKKLKSVSSPRTRGPIRRAVRFDRCCSMTSSQTTPCGYGSRIALRLCGTTAVDFGFGCKRPRHSRVARHCERSAAIHGTSAMRVDCFAALAMTDLGTAGKN